MGLGDSIILVFVFVILIVGNWDLGIVGDDFFVEFVGVVVVNFDVVVVNVFVNINVLLNNGF